MTKLLWITAGILLTGGAVLAVLPGFTPVARPSDEAIIQPPEASTSSPAISLPFELVDRFDLSVLPPLDSPLTPPTARSDPFAALAGWELTGIIHTDTSPIVMLKRGHENRTLRKNEILDGMILAEVRDRTVVFEAGGQSRELSLPVVRD